jgi:hypothetical protein
MIRQFLLSVLILGLVALAGCGPTITQVSEPVAVTIKVTADGKPVDNVTLSLQALEEGRPAVADVVKGEAKATVVPGKYTYFIDKGKTEADLAKIPEKYRLGAMERTLEIKQAGSYEIQL